MTVAELRKILQFQALIQEQCGTSRKTVEELLGLVEKLGCFESWKLSEWGDFLPRAEEYHRTGVVPAGGGKRGGGRAKAPAVDPQELRVRVVGLYERAATATDEEIAAARAALGKLKKAQLEPIAADLGLRGKLTVKQILEGIERQIRDRRGMAWRSEL